MSNDRVIYERPAPRVCRIVLNRPEARNAQDTRLLYALNDAFDRAAQDDDVSVIILAAAGPHFSAGHDLREENPARALADIRPVGTWGGFECPGCEGRMGFEKEAYLGLSERWRNLPKPTIAQVHGKVIAGGLMLVWPCDLVVAAEGTQFADNTVAMGVSGAEYFAHPWELGPRRAKEMLFTADFVSADAAWRAGMVNHVVPLAELETFTLDLATRIAQKPRFALKLAKEAVNAAQDAQGRPAAMQTAFALHQLCHAHNMMTLGTLIDARGILSAAVPAPPSTDGGLVA